MWQSALFSMPVQDGIVNRLVMLEGAFGRVFEQAMDWADEDFKNEIEAIKWPKTSRGQIKPFVPMEKKWAVPVTLLTLED